MKSTNCLKIEPICGIWGSGKGKGHSLDRRKDGEGPVPAQRCLTVEEDACRQAEAGSSTVIHRRAFYQPISNPYVPLLVPVPVLTLPVEVDRWKQNNFAHVQE
jgi:hypothetical protein